MWVPEIVSLGMSFCLLITATGLPLMIEIASRDSRGRPVSFRDGSDAAGTVTGSAGTSAFGSVGGGGMPIDVMGVSLRLRRSEERRVGKECWCRWSLYKAKRIVYG